METSHPWLTVSDLRPGEHIGLVYEQADERLSVLVLFIIAGLQRGEKVQVFTGDLSGPQALIGPLSAAGLDADSLLQQRQLVAQAGLPDWRAEGEVAAWLHRETARALAQGYTGLRIAIETPAFPQSISAAELEAGLDAGLSESICAVLCLHPRTALQDPDRLWQLLQIHSTMASAAMSLGELAARRQAEEALREREAYHISFFENRFEAMLLIDPDTGAIVDANPAACDFYGYERETFKTLQIADIHTLPPEAIWERLQQARRGERSQFEFHHRLADGRIREVEEHCGPIWRHGRERLYSIIHDVTERREAEQALSESRERFARLVETVPGGIIFATPDGRLQFMNAAAERILGITAEAAAHLSYEDLHLRVTAIDGTPLSDEALTFRRVLMRGEPIYGVQCAVRRLDESVIYISVNSAPLYGPRGEIQGVVSSLTDITPLLQAEEAQRQLLAQVEQERQRAEALTVEARRQAEQWDAAFKALAEAVVITDSEGTPTRANPAAVRMYGMDLTLKGRDEAMQNMRLRTPDGRLLTDWQDIPAFRALQGEAVIGGQYLVTNARGEELSVLVSAAPIYVEGQIIGSVMVGHDMTERERFFEQAEQERRRSARLAAEARLEAERWKTIFGALTDMVVLSDSEGRIISANPAAARFFGVDPTQVDRATFEEKMAVRYPEGRRVDPDEFPSSRALRGEIVQSAPFILRGPEGRDVAVEISSMPLRTSDQITGAVSVWHDITEREQLIREIEEERQHAETQAREARQQARWLETVINAMTDVVLIIDAQGRIVRVNPAARQVFGGDPTPMDRMALARKIRLRHLDGKPLRQEELPTSRALRGEVVRGERYRFSLLNEPDPGSDLTLTVSASPVRVGETMIGAVSVWRDVTEHERLVQRVDLERCRAQLEAEQLGMLFSAMTDVIMVTDEKGKILSANPAAERFFGVDPLQFDRETLGEKTQISHLDGRPLRLAEFPVSRCLRTGEPVLDERYLINNAAGQRLIMSFSGIPLRRGEQIIGAVSVWHDVTEREALLRQVEQERQRAEAQSLEARQQAQWLAAVINAIAEVVLIVDTTGHIVQGNPMAHRFFGVDPVQIDRQILAQMIRFSHEDGRPVRPEEFPTTQALQGEITEQKVYRATRHTGYESYVLTSASPVRYEGRVIGAVVAWHDITEREQLLQQLEREHQQARQQADKWNAVFKSMTDAVLLYDATGKLISANPEASRLYGLENLTAYGRERMIWDSQMRYPDGRRVERIEEVPSSRALRGETVTDERFVFTNAQGKEITVLISASPLWEEDQVIGAVAVWHDVTEREQLLQKVEQSHRLLQTLIDTVPIGIIAVDAEGNLLLRNPVSEEILGSAVYKTVREYLGDYTLHRLDGSLILSTEGPFGRALFRSETLSGDEILIRRYDGTETITEWATNLIRDEAGRIQGAVAAIADITARKQAEAERERLIADLEAERRRLQAILDTLPVGVFIADENGALVESNALASQIWGGKLPMSENPQAYGVYNARWAESGEPVRAETWAMARALSRGERSIGEVLDIERFDGTRGTILNSAAPIRNGEGRIIGAVAVVQDITHQRRLELEAIEQRRQFQVLARELETILETIDAGVVVTDREHRVVRINRALADRMHWPPEEFLGRRISEISGRVEFDAWRRQVLDTGTPQRYQGIRLEEEDFWDLKLAPIYNADGAPEQVLMTYTDVTDHVRARQEAEIARARWLTTLTTIPLPVIFVDPEGAIQVANAAAQQVWQLPLVGQPWDRVADERMLINPETGQPVPKGARPMARALRGETVRDFEVLLARPDGERIPLLVHTTPVRMEGGVIGVVLVAQDLTRLKEADRIKDQFLAMVSHDLRSPLATIQGWAVIAQESNDDPALVRKALDLILKGVQTQHRLINDLLDSAALTVGALRVSPEVQALQPIVELACQGAQAGGAEQGITLTWELTAEPLRAEVDSVRLQQVLGNLISNAYKFTPRGGRVEVRLEREGDQAVLTVRDTGRGIPADHLPHIFERFYSPVGSRQPGSRSLGLGLAIVKALVELQNGTVSAWSEGEQKGSTFAVRLPLAGPSERSE